MSVKSNKARGYAAERELAKRIGETWPTHMRMDRTGLDGGHDLRGPSAIGEVKTVRSGPVWLKSAISQIDNCTDGREKYIFVKLGQGAGKPYRWFVMMELEQFEEAL